MIDAREDLEFISSHGGSPGPPRFFVKITTFQKLKNRGFWASRPIKFGRKPNLEKLMIILSQIRAIWIHFKANPAQKLEFPTKIPKNSDAQKK